MDKQVLHKIYQHHVRLARELNESATRYFALKDVSIQLNRLNMYDQMADSLKNIDLSNYFVFPFDSDNDSSYVIFHRSFSRALTLHAIGLDDEVHNEQNSQSLIEEFSCIKIVELMVQHFQQINIQIDQSNTPTAINFDQLSDFSSELLVASLSLIKQQESLGNFYIIFPKQRFGDSL